MWSMTVFVMLCWMAFACGLSANAQGSSPALTTAWRAGQFIVNKKKLVGQSAIVLQRPNTSAQSAMPLGNGRLGVAAWSAEGLTAQLNRSDTMPYRYSPGQVIVPGIARLTGSGNYSGRLDLYNGVFTESGGGMRANIYVAPHRDALVIEVTGANPHKRQTAELRLWAPRHPKSAIWGKVGCLYETWRDDTLPGNSGRRFGSLSTITAEGRDVTVEVKDPLTIVVRFYPSDDGSFRVIAGAPHFDGIKNARAIALETVAPGFSLARDKQWWNKLWKRTDALRVSSSDGAGNYMENLRALDLFTAAAGNRGLYPASAGVADLFSSVRDLHHWDPAGYWHWNLRMQVAANLGAGLPELNEPYFRLYRDNITNMEQWTKSHWDSRQGVCLPETMRFNGNGIIYEAKDPTRKKNVLSSNCDEHAKPYYNARTISTGAEVSLWIWRQYLATGDRRFLANNFPIMLESAKFLMSYETPGPDGLLHTSPSNAHETQWDTTDPTTDIAARMSLYTITREAAKILGGNGKFIAQLTRELHRIPPFPRTGMGAPLSLLTSAADADGNDVIAESYHPAQQNKNYENIGLEPVWPYEVIDNRSPLFELAKRTYFHRPYRMKEDWSFDPIQAAQLDLGNQVSSTLMALTERYQTFPNGFANWGGTSGEFYIEQIGIVAAALQMALVQEHDGEIVTAPAVPAHWSMEGSVAVSGRSRVDVQVQNGVTTMVAIEAGTNKTIRLRNPWPGHAVDVVASGTKEMLHHASPAPVIAFPVKAGKSYLVCRSDSPQLRFAPISGEAAHTPRRLGPVQLGLFARDAKSPVVNH